MKEIHSRRRGNREEKAEEELVPYTPTLTTSRTLVQPGTSTPGTNPHPSPQTVLDPGTQVSRRITGPENVLSRLLDTRQTIKPTACEGRFTLGLSLQDVSLVKFIPPLLYVSSLLLPLTVTPFRRTFLDDRVGFEKRIESNKEDRMTKHLYCEREKDWKRVRQGRRYERDQ